MPVFLCYKEILKRLHFCLIKGILVTDLHVLNGTMKFTMIESMYNKLH